MITTDQFIVKLNQKLENILKVNKPLELAVRSVMSLQSKRIFIDGLNSSEAIIGNYKGKDIYISPNANKTLPKFPLKGKNGDTEFKNGKKHKTGYFKNYLDFKGAVGRNKKVKTVDLFLTGELSRDFSNAETLGAANAEKISPNLYRVNLSQENLDKTARYGKVFNLSNREKEKFLAIVKFELAKALR